MKRFKTFLATYPPAGGLIRVVLVQNDDNRWVAFFCTDSSASVADILELVADRSAIEQVFHDAKEVHGAGQQQLRNVWANVAAWHLHLWLYSLVAPVGLEPLARHVVRSPRLAVGQSGTPAFACRSLESLAPRVPANGMIASRGRGPLAAKNPGLHHPARPTRRVTCTSSRKVQLCFQA